VADARPLQHHLTDPSFRQAVDALDAGDVAALGALLDEHPELLSQAARFSETSFVSGTQPGQYFERPKLLWFVAENPTRNARLPDAIVEVVRCIVDRQRVHGADTLQRDLDYTLMLVTSGYAARQAGKLRALVDVLVRSGADPNCADAALAHAEREGVQALLDHGARVTLPIAAGMGRIDDLRRLLPTADRATKQNALVCAAVCGDAQGCALLVDHGADPSAYNEVGFHPHCTPLHNAIASGSADAVDALLVRGADTTVKDTMHHGDALDWARHLGHTRIAERVEHARRDR